MVRCTCGKDSTEGPGMAKVWAACGFCTGGYNRCTRCSWHGNTRLKCCGRCEDGKVRCTQRGCVNGRREVNQVCGKPHNQRR